METKDLVMFAGIVLLVAVLVSCTMRSQGKNRSKHEAKKVAAAAEEAAYQQDMERRCWPQITDKPATKVSRRLGLDLDVPEWDDSWRLPEKDLGCFTFTATKGGGLVIALATTMNPDSMHDSEGYGIVIDNQDVERPRSWIGVLPHFTREMPNSKVNHGYRMPAPPEKQTYWVYLRYGYIVVGTGDEPGKDVILVGQDATPRGGIQYFGFGSWGKSLGWGQRGAKHADGFIEGVSVCRVTPKLPMPSEHTACRQNPALCPQKVPVPLQSLDIERYYRSRNYKGRYS